MAAYVSKAKVLFVKTKRPFYFTCLDAHYTMGHASLHRMEAHLMIQSKQIKYMLHFMPQRSRSWTLIIISLHFMYLTEHCALCNISAYIIEGSFDIYIICDHVNLFHDKYSIVAYPNSFFKLGVLLLSTHPIHLEKSLVEMSLGNSGIHMNWTYVSLAICSCLQTFVHGQNIVWCTTPSISITLICSCRSHILSLWSSILGTWYWKNMKFPWVAFLFLFGAASLGPDIERIWNSHEWHSF